MLILKVAKLQPKTAFYFILHVIEVAAVNCCQVTSLKQNRFVVVVVVVVVVRLKMMLSHSFFFIFSFDFCKKC